MPTLVQIPDRGVVSFPDEMSLDEIDAVIRRNFQPADEVAQPTVPVGADLDQPTAQPLGSDQEPTGPGMPASFEDLRAAKLRDELAKAQRGIQPEERKPATEFGEGLGDIYWRTAGGLVDSIHDIATPIARLVNKAFPGVDMTSAVDEYWKGVGQDIATIGAANPSNHYVHAVGNLLGGAAYMAPMLASGPASVPVMAAQGYESSRTKVHDYLISIGCDEETADRVSNQVGLLTGVLIGTAGRYASKIPGINKLTDEAIDKAVANLTGKELAGRGQEIAIGNVVKRAVHDAIVMPLAYTAPQQLIEKLTYRPNLTWGEAAAEDLHAAESGALFGTVMRGSVEGMRGIRGDFARLAEQRAGWTPRISEDVARGAVLGRTEAERQAFAQPPESVPLWQREPTEQGTVQIPPQVPKPVLPHVEDSIGLPVYAGQTQVGTIVGASGAGIAVQYNGQNQPTVVPLRDFGLQHGVNVDTTPLTPEDRQRRALSTISAMLRGEQTTPNERENARNLILSKEPQGPEEPNQDYLRRVLIKNLGVENIGIKPPEPVTPVTPNVPPLTTAKVGTKLPELRVYMAQRGYTEGQSGVGWKFHLSTDDPEAASKWLTENGFLHKVGRNSGQTGKDVTVYIGSRDKAIEAAAKIEAGIGGILKPPSGDAIEELPFSKNIVGRFDIPYDDTFARYGIKESGGASLLADDQYELYRMANKTKAPRDQIDIFRMFAGERALKAAEQRYGEFFTGRNPDTGQPEVPPVTLPPTQAATWFHASHAEIKELSPRTVETVDSVGTWVTGSKEAARTLYGPKVYSVEATPQNLVEAHTSNFDDFFFSNRNLFAQLFPNEPASTFNRFREKGLAKTAPEIYGMRATYLRAFRQMLQDAGYDGVVWRNSTIDLRQGDKPHDVAVLFNKEPLQVKLEGEPNAIREQGPAEVRVRNAPTVGEGVGGQNGLQGPAGTGAPEVPPQEAGTPKAVGIRKRGVVTTPLGLEVGIDTTKPLDVQRNQIRGIMAQMEADRDNEESPIPWNEERYGALQNRLKEIERQMLGQARPAGVGIRKPAAKPAYVEPSLDELVKRWPDWETRGPMNPGAGKEGRAAQRPMLEAVYPDYDPVHHDVFVDRWNRELEKAQQYALGIRGEPPAPPKTGGIPEGFTEQDVRALLGMLNEGKLPLLASDKLGIPTIHDMRNAEQVGYGVFRIRTPAFEGMFDAGSMMAKLPGGQSYTTLSVSKGTAPYDVDAARKVLEGYIPKEPARVPKVKGANPSNNQELANWVREQLEKHRQFDWRELFAKADEAFGGTQAQGTYTVKDAYDAMELGVNQHISDPIFKTIFDPAQKAAPNPREIVERLKRVISLLPTQTKRTAEQDEWQQFSTPPPLAFVVAWLGNIRPGEMVLEPSAGVGGIGAFAKNAGGRVIVNELSPRRRSLIEQMGFDRVFGENAEQLNNVLPEDVKPTVVLMNPPFSATGGRLQGIRKTRFAEAHIDEALRRLEPGGRLVAIVGEGMAMDRPAFRDWWKDTRSKYRVRANVGVSGEEYAKYGTTFDNQVLVIDKVGPTFADPVTGKVQKIEDLIPLLQRVRDERTYEEPGKQTTTEPAIRPPESGAGEPGGPAVAGIRKRKAKPGPAPRLPTGGLGAGQPGGEGGEQARPETPPVGNKPVAPGGGAGLPAGPEGSNVGEQEGGTTAGGEPGKVPEPAGGGAAGGEPAGTAGVGEGAALGPVGKPGFGESNTFFTKDRAEAARERLRAKVRQVGVGIDPEILRDAIELGGYYVEGGVRKFADWSRQMVSDIGEEIRPYLKSVYLSLRNYPGMDKAKMDSESEIDRQEEEAEKPKAPEPGTVSVESKATPEPTGKIEPDRVFETYQPQISVEGGQPHPTPLSQSAAMASVRYPMTDYKPKLEDYVVQEGRLSVPQLEAIIQAGAAHSRFLPNGERHGYFIGDGTGVGKGREITGIFADNWNRGKRKGVWISANDELMSSAKRDFEALGLNAPIIDHGDTDTGAEIKAKEGILFTTYSKLPATAKAKQGQRKDQMRPRWQQIVNWLGKDFDGVIVFDEAHKMANSMDTDAGGRKKEAAQRAKAGVDLQKALPNARIVYVSATGATEVSGLAFAERLGLWGQETPFPQKKDFIAAIGARGLAAMEITAKDMKAAGVYIARNLDFTGVTQERVTQALNPDQVKLYNTMARAWQVVLQNMQAALEDTGAGHDTRAQMVAKGQFWGAHQRFFNQLLTSLQLPAVFEAIDRDLERGEAVVIQLTSTYEEATKRSAARAVEEGRGLETVDITPRETLKYYVEKSFPVQQYEEYTDEDGNIRLRPAVDSAGNPVINREALAKRTALMSEIENLSVPMGALDEIINRYGPDMVAEVTGRKQRLGWVTDREGRKKLDWIKRGAKAIESDVSAFNNDKKRILIFSEKGGTGASYHADLTYPNHRKRNHYILQAGWRADNAVQGLGRSHRSNQAVAPAFKLVETDLPGHRRFISTIARRIEQLGALTKGQRQAAGQSIFDAKDNLESSYAKEALRNFLIDVNHGRVEGVSVQDFAEQTGLTTGMGAIDENTPIKLFLNRVLSMKVDMQRKVFDAFSKKLDQTIEYHLAKGTLDQGIETLSALTTKKVSDIELWSKPGTDQKTRLVELEQTHPTKVIPWSEDWLTKYDQRFFVNNRSGQVWRTDRKPYVTTNVKGEEERVYLAENVRSNGSTIHPADIATNYRELTPEEARITWNEQVQKAPKTYTHNVSLLTGTVLPIWDRIGYVDRIARAQVDNGERLLGVVQSQDSIPKLLENFGKTPQGAAIEVPDAVRTVMRGEGVLRLANGWKIELSKVSGQDRIEIEGPSYAHEPELKRLGIFMERIGWQNRYFIPTERAESIIDKLHQTRPIIAIDRYGEPPSGGAAPFSLNPENEESISSEPESVDRLLSPSQQERKAKVAEALKANDGGSSFLSLQQMVRAGVFDDIGVTGEVAKELLNLGDKGVKLTFGGHFNYGTETIPRWAGGRYDPKTDTVNIYDDAMIGHRVFLHEYVHALTYDAIRRGGKPVDDLRQLFHLAWIKATREGLDFYGLQWRRDWGMRQEPNLDEFIAEAMGNRRFQEFLARTRGLSDRPKSLWESFVDLVGRLLGIKRASALADVLRITGDLVNQREAPPDPVETGDSLFSINSLSTPEEFKKAAASEGLGHAEDDLLLARTGHVENHVAIAHALPEFHALPSDVRKFLPMVQGRADAMELAKASGDRLAGTPWTPPAGTFRQVVEAATPDVNGRQGIVLASANNILELLGQSQVLTQKTREAAQEAAVALRVEQQKLPAQRLQELAASMMSERRGELLAARDRARQTGDQASEAAADQELSALRNTEVAASKVLESVLKAVPDRFLNAVTPREDIMQAWRNRPANIQPAASPEVIAAVERMMERTPDLSAKLESIKHPEKSARVLALEKRATDMAEANKFLQNAIADPQFQANYKGAMELVPMSERVAKEGANGEDIFENPKDKTQSVSTVAGTSREAFDATEGAYLKAKDWFEDYLDPVKTPNPDPLLAAGVARQLDLINRIYLNQNYNPAIGRPMSGGFNPFSWIMRLFPQAFDIPEYIAQMAGGKQASENMRALSMYGLASKRVTDSHIKHRLEPTEKCKAAAKEHGMAVEDWARHVGQEILGSYQGRGYPRIKVGDHVWGAVVSKADMDAVDAMKRYCDRVIQPVREMAAKRGGAVLIKDAVLDRYFEREPIDPTGKTVPQALTGDAMAFVDKWEAINKLKVSDAVKLDRKIALLDGDFNEPALIGHIRASYDPEYSGLIKSPYRGDYIDLRRELDNTGHTVTSVDELAQRIFDARANLPPDEQQSMDEIRKQIVSEIDHSVNLFTADERDSEKLLDQERPLVKIMTAENFMNRPRGRRLLPQGFYVSTVSDWNEQARLRFHVLNVFAQRYVNQLSKSQWILSEQLREMGRAIEAGRTTRKELTEKMASGDNFLDYTETEHALKATNREIARFQEYVKQRQLQDSRMYRVMNLAKNLAANAVLQTPGPMITVATTAPFRYAAMESTLLQSGRTGLLGFGPIGATASAAKWLTLWTKNLIDTSVGTLLNGPKLGPRAVELANYIHANRNALAQAVGPVIDYMMRQRARIEYERTNDIVEPDPWREKLAAIAKGLVDARESGERTVDQRGRAYNLARTGVEGLNELGLPFQAPRAWGITWIGALNNSMADVGARSLLGNLILFGDRAFKTRSALGYDPVKTILTPQEIFGTKRASPGDAAELRQMFDRAQINFDRMLIEYRQKKESRQITGDPIDAILTHDQLARLEYEMGKYAHKQSFENRPVRTSPLGRFAGLFYGYAMNQNAQMARTFARNTIDNRALWSQGAEIFNKAATYLFLTALFADIAEPTIAWVKHLLWNQEPARRPVWRSRSVGEAAKITAANMLSFLPIIGRTAMVTLGAAPAGSSFSAGTVQLYPLALAQNIQRLFSKGYQTGAWGQSILDFIRSFAPNTRVWANRLPGRSGLQTEANVRSILTANAPPAIEIKPNTYQTGSVQYSPARGNVDAVVNALSKPGGPDMATVRAERKAGIAALVKAGKTPDDAEQAFDRSIVARNPFVSIFGRNLTEKEMADLRKSLSPEELSQLDSFIRGRQAYAREFGTTEPDFIHSESGGGGRAAASPLGLAPNQAVSRGFGIRMPGIGQGAIGLRGGGVSMGGGGSVGAEGQGLEGMGRIGGGVGAGGGIGMRIPGGGLPRSPGLRSRGIRGLRVRASTNRIRGARTVGLRAARSRNSRRIRMRAR